MQLPLTISLKASPTLVGLLIIAHTAALAVLRPLDLPVVIKASFAALILLSAVATLRRALRPHFAALTLNADGSAEAAWRDGTRCVVRILGPSTALPGCVVLLLRGELGNQRLTLLPDATGFEAHRQLRLWLKWRAAID